jgi:hypothetical protein
MLDFGEEKQFLRRSSGILPGLVKNMATLHPELALLG